MSQELSAFDSASAVGQSAAPLRWSGWSDWVGMFASIGCAIHCAAMPFVIAYLPAFGLSFLADEAFHQWMAVGCFIIALTAFVPGIRNHRRLTPVIIGSVGLMLISVAAFGFAGDCCAACESNVATAGLTDSGSTVESFASPDTEGCSDAGCPHCANESSAVDTEDASVVQESTDATPTQFADLSLLGSRIAPWLTPLGGIVLVIAHLLNRRYGCSCRNCENELATGAA